MDDDATQRRRDALAGGCAPPGRPSDDPSPFDAGGHLLAETLSSYLDDAAAFAPAQRRAIAAHLAGCDACRATLGELRALVSALAALPEPAAPRSFALEPRNARTPAAAPAPSRGWTWAHARLGALRWATVAAALLFVLVVGADQLGGNPGQSQSATTQDATTLRTTSAAAPAAATESAGGAANSGGAANAPEPTATTGAAAAMSAASPASGGAAADSAASPESYALKSAPAQATAVEPAPAPAVQEAASRGESRWRIVEAVLALLVAWLLGAMLIVPRVVGRADDGTP